MFKMCFNKIDVKHVLYKTYLLKAFYDIKFSDESPSTNQNLKER
jgi:hypothetical protein